VLAQGKGKGGSQTTKGGPNGTSVSRTRSDSEVSPRASGGRARPNIEGWERAHVNPKEKGKQSRLRSSCLEGRLM